MSTTTPGEPDPTPAPTAPVDPRSSWRLPALGQLPVMARLDELVGRVVAPNPSAMTLDGTNTYVVAAPGTGEAAVVDPGPADEDHLARVESLLLDADLECRWIVVTHGHIDHSEAALLWSQRLGARIVAASPVVAGGDGLVVASGHRLPLATTILDVVATPGHSPDHIALRLENGAVLTGDHVLGRGTSVVGYPDGDLAAYLESLRRLLDLAPIALYPGHGPELREDCAAVLRYYLEQRRFRESQVVELLRTSDVGLPPTELVGHIYADLDRELWPAAERSTRAVLEKLRNEGVVALEDEGTARLVQR